MELGNVAPLLAAWESDPWGKLRPPLSAEAMQLSAQLASATYRMDVQQWLKAGWRDLTIQVDGDLTDGLDPKDQSAVQKLASAWKLYRVRQRMRGGNPLEQVMGAFRQKEKSDTGKALVMIHPADIGRYVVAISFMGTGERFYDWFSNFRMTSEGGVHKGFLQLTRQFEDNEQEIDFPETARELGLEKLTLRHVLREMRHPNSRFTLWMCGHSQGAALMQVYARRKIREDGVLPRNMVGYGFAAPSVMSGLAEEDPASYPLFLVQNGDDLVPRMGAQVHLGLCLIYPTTEEMRRQCYTWRTDSAGCYQRQAVGQVLARMRDTASSIEVTLAYMNALGGYTPEDMLEALEALGVRLPVKRLLSAADSRVDALLHFTARHLKAAYASITGKPLEQARVARHQQVIEAVIAQIGLRAYNNTLIEWMSQPHRLSTRADNGKPSPYVYITQTGLAELIPAIWFGGRPPQMVFAAHALGDNGLQGVGVELFNRRMTTPPRRVHRHPRYADPRQRSNTRHVIPTLEPGAMMPGERIVYVK